MKKFINYKLVIVTVLLFMFFYNKALKINNINDKLFRYSPADEYSWSNIKSSQFDIPTPKPKTNPSTSKENTSNPPTIEKIAIYGEENLSEYYQMPKDKKELADSTVALVFKNRLFYDEEKNKYIPITYLFTNIHNMNNEKLFKDDKILSFCSGFLVSNSLLLTAGHCIEENGNLSKDNIYVVFGWKRDKNKFNLEFDKEDVYEVSDVIMRKLDQYEDWAILRLSKETNKKPLVLDRLDLYGIGDDIFAIGYPLGITVKLADNAKIYNIIGNKLIANLDTFKGNSGSPVFNLYNRVIGILVSGKDDFYVIVPQDLELKLSYKNTDNENIKLIEKLVASLREEGKSQIEIKNENQEIIYIIRIPERVKVYDTELTYQIVQIIAREKGINLRKFYARYKDYEAGEAIQKIVPIVKTLIPLTQEERIICNKIYNNMRKTSYPYSMIVIDPHLQMLYKSLQCDKDVEI